MDFKVQFLFRGASYHAIPYISFEEDPCFIFITLEGKEVIEEFGEEISIKTDCETVLPKKDSYPELEELRNAIFDAVKQTKLFQIEKAKYYSNRRSLARS